MGVPEARLGPPIFLFYSFHFINQRQEVFFSSYHYILLLDPLGGILHSHCCLRSSYDVTIILSFLPTVKWLLARVSMWWDLRIDIHNLIAITYAVQPQTLR